MAVKNYLINDKWLDIDKQNIVEVKSTDGVIGSVKLNGEEYGGGGGSEMFKIATVTIVNNSTGGWGLSGGITSDNNSIDGYGFLVLSDNIYLISANEGVPKQSTKTLQAILMPQNGEMGAVYTTVGNGTPTVTGNAKYYYEEEEEIGTVYITGDCTITIS